MLHNIGYAEWVKKEDGKDYIAINPQKKWISILNNQGTRVMTCITQAPRTQGWRGLFTLVSTTLACYYTSDKGWRQINKILYCTLCIVLHCIIADSHNYRWKVISLSSQLFKNILVLISAYSWCLWLIVVPLQLTMCFTAAEAAGTKKKNDDDITFQKHYTPSKKKKRKQQQKKQQNKQTSKIITKPEARK